MATLNEIAEILAERVGRQTDIPFQEMLKPLIVGWAARLTKNSLEKRAFHRRHFIVSLLVDLKETEDIKCEDKKCKILKSVTQVPEPIRANNILFDYVGNSDHTEPYDFMNEYELAWIDGSKYTKKRKKYFYKNKHIYVRAYSNLENVAVDMIPADVTEVTKFCGDKCYNDNMEFPIHPDLLQPLIRAILTSELRQVPQTEDTKVNADKEVN